MAALSALTALTVWGYDLWWRMDSDRELPPIDWFSPVPSPAPLSRAARTIQAAHRRMRFRRQWRERPDPTSIMGSTTVWDHAPTRTRRNYYNDAGHWTWIYH